jgi:hypothetical protein
MENQLQASLDAPKDSPTAAPGTHAHRISHSEDAFTAFARGQRLSVQSSDSEATVIDQPARKEHGLLEKKAEETIQEVVAEEEAQNPGFSASQFASYENRIKDSIAKSEDTKRSRHLSRRSVTFESASDLEKGIITPLTPVEPVTKPDNVFVNSHSRTTSSTTIASTWTVDTIHVPAKKQSKWVRDTRHTWLNVYRRLFSIVVLGNLIGFICFLVNWSDHNESSGSPATRLPLSDMATAASANIMVAILVRQDYIVNLMFKTLWYIPHSWPLKLRCMAAKVYENGGVHSGAAVAGTIWFILLTVSVTVDFVENGWKTDGTWISVLVLTYILVSLLVAIVILAFPRFRFMRHNTFEYTHRFAGWTAVAIFWAEIFLLAHQNSLATHSSLGLTLIKLPTFWFLAIITFHIILPWLRLRKWHFTPEQLSTHALRLRFDTDVPALSGMAIAEHPLGEWHPFATFPNWDSHLAEDGRPNIEEVEKTRPHGTDQRGLIAPLRKKNRAGGVGGSMIISDAGDWTRRTILDPKNRYWVKGLPKTGVLSMAFCFSRVVVVTTGSGIGPCLSFLLEPIRKNTECRVLWSTPSPLKTYGAGILNAVRAVDKDAVIIDTRASGRPDMVALAYGLYEEMQAEAIFIISNPKLTRKVVYSMETRGIPAFGPIWDS